MSKIFGIGFHKTGSTTLETALITLGFDCVGKNDHLFDAVDQNNWDEVNLAIDQHDAFRDMPWPLFYKKIDEQYPGSKFILTIRNSEAWMASCSNHYKEMGVDVFARIYGEGHHFPVGNEKIWIDRYERHTAEVIEYFKDRPNDLLVVNWENNAGWKELCNFLNKDIPARPFPHANKGKYTLWGKVLRKLEYVFDRKGYQKRNRDL